MRRIGESQAIVTPYTVPPLTGISKVQANPDNMPVSYITGVQPRYRENIQITINKLINKTI